MVFFKINLLSVDKIKNNLPQDKSSDIWSKVSDLSKTPHVSQNSALIKTFKSLVLELNCILAIFHLTKVGMGRELASI